MTTGVRGWVWGATAGSFVVLWALFFVVLSRRPHEPSLRENASWLAFVVGLTASFVSALWAVEGGRATADFASEYLQQYVLSVDAVFLTAATMARFATPRSFQQKAIVVATSIALVIRTIMVLAGWVLTNVWVWLAFVTAVLYAIRAMATLRGEREDGNESAEPARARWLNRLSIVSTTYDSARLVTKMDGRRRLTPLAVVAVAVATSDMLFAPEPGDPYRQFTATALALMLVIPLQFLLAGTPFGDLLRLGRLLAVILALMCVRMLLTGAAAVHLTHVGNVRLPSGFADSVWISLVLSVIVTGAIGRYTFGIRSRRRRDFRSDGTLDPRGAERRDDGFLTPRSPELRSDRIVSRPHPELRSDRIVSRPHPELRSDRIVSRPHPELRGDGPPVNAHARLEVTVMPGPQAIPAIRFRLPDGRYLRRDEDAAGRLVAADVAAPGAAETFAVVAPPTWPPRSGDALEFEALTNSWNLSGLRMRVDHNIVVLPPRRARRSVRTTYEVGGPGTGVFVRLSFPATYPAYPGDDPAERVFTLVRAPGGHAARDGAGPRTDPSLERVMLRISSHRGRQLFLRAADHQPCPAIHADGTAAGPPGTVFTAVYGTVVCGSAWIEP